MADATYTPKVYMTDGGDKQVVASGGEVDVESGGALKLAGTAIAATAAEINAVADNSTRIVTAAAATLAVTVAAHAGKIIRITKADGCKLTLPAATGSGAVIKVLLGVTPSGGSAVIETSATTQHLQGSLYGGITTAATGKYWVAAATDDTITLNGTTTGGYIGDMITLIDAAATIWTVQSGAIQQSGSAATPFSAAVA